MFKQKDGEEPRAGNALWSANKDILKWIISFIVSAAVAWGSATTKLSTLQTKIDVLENKDNIKSEQIVNLRIETATLKAELRNLKRNK
jgi:hypothetical protein